MKRIVPICVALGVVAGLFLVFGGSGGEHARRSRQRKRKARKPRPPLIVLAGEVRKAKAPVPDATVFLLDHKAYGGDRHRLPHVVTDAKGRFRIRTRKIKDRWIGVVHERHMHAHQDLNALDATQPIVFELKTARRVVVTVLDDDKQPVPNQLVQLTPWPPIDLYELPDPKHRQGEHTGITDVRGRAEYWIGSEGPVTLRPELDGYFPEPHEVHLAADEGVALIRARKGVAFHVAVPAPGTGTVYDGPLDVALYCGKPDYRLHSVRGARAVGGRIEGLWPPGLFGVLITVPGGAPLWRSSWYFGGANLDSRLDGAGRGMRSIQFDPPWDNDEALVFTRGETGGEPLRGFVRAQRDDGGKLRIAQGPCTLLAIRSSEGRAAVLREGVTASTTPKLKWETGTWTRLKDHAIPAEARYLRVEHETLGNLPLIGRTGKRTRTGIELLHIHVGRPDSVVELGPYPPGKITVRGVR